MNYIHKNVCNWLMLILSISLIQWHSIQFWMHATDDIGWLWSITIEAAGIWLWWQRYTLLACLASFILITGPLFGLAFPMIDTASLLKAKNQQYSSRLAAIKKDIQQLEGSLISYQLTSQTRIGWAARIDKTQGKLNVANQRFKLLLQDTPTPLNNSKIVMIITIEVATLLLLILTQVLAIGKLRTVSKPKIVIETPLETVSNHQPEDSIDSDPSVSINPKCLATLNSDIEILAQDLTKRLDQVLHKEKISQAEWARRNDVSAKNVSLLRNYVKRKNLRQELIPKKELMRIKKLLIKPITTH